MTSIVISACTTFTAWSPFLNPDVPLVHPPMNPASKGSARPNYTTWRSLRRSRHQSQGSVALQPSQSSLTHWNNLLFNPSMIAYSVAHYVHAQSCEAIPQRE